MNIELGYGKEKVKICVPDKNLQAVLKPNRVRTDLTGEEEVVRALKHPIGCGRLSDIVRAGKVYVL